MTDTKSSSISSDVEKWGAVETREEDVYAVDEQEEKRCVCTYVVECRDPDAFLRLVRRIDIRLVPTSMFIYLLCFLDRSNIVCVLKLLNAGF